MLVYDPKSEPTGQIEGRLIDMIAVLKEQNVLLCAILDKLSEVKDPEVEINTEAYGFTADIEEMGEAVSIEAEDKPTKRKR